MRIHKTVRKVIGFICLFMALASLRLFIPDIRDHRIYDPEVFADLVWMGIFGFGIWWGFRNQTKPADVDGTTWPEEKQKE